VIEMPLQGAAGDVDLLGDRVRRVRPVYQERNEDVAGGLPAGDREGSPLAFVVLRPEVVGAAVKRLLDDLVGPLEFSEVVLDLSRREVQGASEFVEVDARVGCDVVVDLLAGHPPLTIPGHRGPAVVSRRLA